MENYKKYRTKNNNKIHPHSSQEIRKQAELQRSWRRYLKSKFFACLDEGKSHSQISSFFKSILIGSEEIINKSTLISEIEIHSKSFKDHVFLGFLHEELMDEQIKAQAHYEIGSANGNPYAHYFLGCHRLRYPLIYVVRTQRPEDKYTTREKSLFYLRKAAERGILLAQYRYALHTKVPSLAGFHFLKCAAERGHQNSSIRLARYYERGMATKQDLHEALRWLNQASKCDFEAYLELDSIFNKVEY
ncbi:hypothetical protein G9A89_010918 [Geosiphon pyriformis]|nr:hypothetical protein G9A89_010918 [Geosiphon pyriformis]